MRWKLGLLIFGILVVFGFFNNVYVIGTLETDAKEKLRQALVQSQQVYLRANRANRELRLDVATSFARQPRLISAILAAQSIPEDHKKHDSIQLELDTFCELESESCEAADAFILLNTEGLELARTKQTRWRKITYNEQVIKNPKMVKDALAGIPGEDVWSNAGSWAPRDARDDVYIVDAVPIHEKGVILGAILMASRPSETLVLQERQIISNDYHYVIFTKDRAVMSSGEFGAEALGRLNQEWFGKNKEQIAKVLLSRTDQLLTTDSVLLGETYYQIVYSALPTYQTEAAAGFMLIANESLYLKQFGGSRIYMFTISLLLCILGIAGSLLIIQRAYNLIDFILEGAHQIIVGNKEYVFSNPDEYLNQFGQTLNLMIAILLGKYIPEDDEEAAQVISAMSPQAAAKPHAIPQDRVLIEPMESGGAAAGSDAELPADRTAYYDQLYREFIEAKKSVGEDISQITKDRMVAKLIKTEEKLMAAHGCKAVRFVVRVEGNKVTLKPVPM